MPRNLGRSLLVGASILGATAAGCMGNFSPTQRVQDAANDLSTAAHFGRMDVAVQHVSQPSREKFNRQHESWGTDVRIVDCDLTGLHLQDKEHADVTISVNWQRIEESEMRSTQLVQHWRDHQGNWLLESEERTTGDVGLLGEPTTVVRPAPSRLQFQTITIR